jgi:hypothetical protein
LPVAPGPSPAIIAVGRRPSPDNGRRYAPTPTVEEIVAVMRCAGDTAYGLRTRALIVRRSA